MRKNSKKLLKQQGNKIVALPEAARMLMRGAIGVLLTDTIYGLVGRANSRHAVRRIYEVKGRDEGKPLIVLLSSLADLRLFRIELTSREQKMVRNILRGSRRPTTIILPTPWKHSEYLHRGTERFRFRIPHDAALKRLLRVSGPLVAPSANLQGEEPATTIREAQHYFGGKVDFYVDGGTRRGKPSRLVQLHADGSLEVIRR